MHQINNGRPRKYNFNDIDRTGKFFKASGRSKADIKKSCNAIKSAAYYFSKKHNVPLSCVVHHGGVSVYVI